MNGLGENGLARADRAFWASKVRRWTEALVAVGTVVNRSRPNRCELFLQIQPDSFASAARSILPFWFRGICWTRTNFDGSSSRIIAVSQYARKAA